MGFSMRAFLMRWWFWFVLALPAVGIAVQFFSGHDEHLLHNLLEPSGEASARLLIIALCATPLSMALPGWRGPRWLVRNRRAIGVAAFLYGCLHLVLYVVSIGSFRVMWNQLGWTYILLGWLAFVVMIPLAMTSTNGAVRRLGRNWKRLHRLAYVAAVATFLHWVGIYGLGIVGNVLLNFLPLLVLVTYRIWRSRSATRNTVA
jgi:methionine sulfoxide reductase heme-binding subunit